MDPNFAPYIAVAMIFLLMAFGTPVFAALALSGAAGIIMVEDFHDNCGLHPDHYSVVHPHGQLCATCPGRQETV
jgi:hypothetical protein